MPDGDQIYGKLKPRYRSAYEMLCEEKFSSEEIKRKVLRAIKKSVKNLGDDALSHIELMAKNIHEVFQIGALSKMERCSLASKGVESIRSTNKLKLRDKHILIDAAKAYINDVKYGNISIIGNEPEQILSHCFQRIYRAEFVEPVGKEMKHYKDAEPMEVQVKLESVSTDIHDDLDKWARKAFEHQSLQHLRLPQKKRQEVSLEEDLL